MDTHDAGDKTRSLMAPGEPESWLAVAMRQNGTACLRLDGRGCIVDAVGDTAALLGAHAKDCFGRGFHEFAPRGQRARVRASLRRLFAGEAAEAPGGQTTLGDLGPASWKATLQTDGTVVVSCQAEPSDPSANHPLMRLADALPTLIAYLDRNLRFRFNNRACEQLFGLPREALKGRHLSEFLSERAYESMLPKHRRVLAGESVAWADRVEFQDGRIADMQLDYLPDVGAEGDVRGFYAAVQDVTEYVTTINLLKAVHRIVNQAEEPTAQTLRHLLDLGRGHLGLPEAIVVRVEGESCVVDTCIHEDAGPAVGTRFALDETCESLTLASGDLVAIHAAARDGRSAAHRCYRHSKIEAYIGVPLTVDGTTWGTVSFRGREPRGEAFTTLDQELVRLIADGVEHLLRERVRQERDRRERRRLEDLAATDALTGLPNRKAIDTRLAALAASPQAHALALIDLDHFKAINDAHGHEAGDFVLRTSADLMAGALRNSDTVARYGGEEFLVIMKDTDLSEATPILERLRAAIADQPIVLPAGDRIDLTLSIGATESQPEDAPGDAFRRADHALYRAKHAGRNRVEIAPPPASAATP